MDDKTSIQELKNRIKRFCEERDWDQFHNAKDLTIGIVTEASELLEHFRFKSNQEIEEILRSPEKRKHVSEELADALYFILRLAQRYDIDLATELNEKLMKNEKNYPIEKVRGSNKKYTEL